MSKNEQTSTIGDFYCEKCNYTTSRLSNFKRHMDSKLHATTLDYNNKKKRATERKHICICGKSYVHHTSLYKHRKSCEIHIKSEDIDNNSEEIVLTNDTSKNIDNLCNMVTQLIEENKNLQQNLIDISQKPTNVVQNIQNNRFNVINYLNTECKDAMNLSDYVANIQYSFDDLQYLHDNGLVKSIERTFIQGLLDMDKTKRPIHCSDSKRSQFYVKDQDEWTKDNERDIIISSLKRITDQQCDVLKQWKNLNKDWLDNEKKQEFANVVTRKIVDMYADQIQKKILRNLNDLNLKGGI
jgi:glutamate synthase domain-containing protein 2